MGIRKALKTVSRVLLTVVSGMIAEVSPATPTMQSVQDSWMGLDVVVVYYPTQLEPVPVCVFITA